MVAGCDFCQNRVASADSDSALEDDEERVSEVCFGGQLVAHQNFGPPHQLRTGAQLALGQAFEQGNS